MKCSSGSRAVFVGAMALIGGWAAQVDAQLTITSLGDSDPANVFKSGVPADPEDINTFTTFREGDDSTATPVTATGRGQIFLTPDTGDANNGWSLSAITVRWDDANNVYPTSDLGVSLSVYPWQVLNDPTSSNVDFTSGPNELPVQPIASSTGFMPFLTPTFDLFDGDRLQFAFGTPVELRENTAYAFLLEFDRDDVTAVRDNVDQVRLERTTQVFGDIGTMLATTFDYNAAGEPPAPGYTAFNSNTGGSMIYQLSGSSANIGDDPFATLEVDRDTGNLSWKTNLAALADLDIVGYSITTADGRVLTGDADWSSLADSDPDWQEDGTIGPNELSETFIGVAGSDQLSQSTTIDLGNAWDASPFEDLVMTVSTAGGATITLPTRYVSSVGGTEAYELGDYNLNGTIDINDWPTVRDNLLTDVSSLENYDRYLQGDLNRDGMVDETDFLFFRNAFEAANGTGSFALATSNVPEPAAWQMVIAALLLVMGKRRMSGFNCSGIQAAIRVPASVKLALVVAVCLVGLQPTAKAVLVHHYEFETGFELVDSAGSNDLVSIDDPQGSAGTIAFVDGVATHSGSTGVNVGTALVTTSQIGLTETDDWTIAFLARDTDPSDDFVFDGLVSSGIATGAGPESWQIDYRGTPNVGSTPADGSVGTPNNVSVFGNISGGEFRHFAVVHDADGIDNGISVYLDGSLATDNNWAGGRDSIEFLRLFRNRNENATQYFDGSLSDVRVYNNALSESEVQDLVPGFGDDLLTLEVNTTNGQINILGPSVEPQDVIAYRVETDDDSATLDFGNWTGLQANSFDDGGWERAGGSSAAVVAEVRLEGATTFDSNSVASLGSLYDEVADLRNLEFSFIRSDQSTVSGLIEYVVSEGLAGDFNGDGVVDAADYPIWRDNLGTSFDLNGNGDESGDSAGVVDEADYALWRSEFGSTSASAIVATAPVPEPGSMALGGLTVAVCLAWSRLRPRYGEHVR